MNGSLRKCHKSANDLHKHWMQDANEKLRLKIIKQTLPSWSTFQINQYLLAHYQDSILNIIVILNQALSGDWLLGQREWQAMLLGGHENDQSLRVKCRLPWVHFHVCMYVCICVCVCECICQCFWTSWEGQGKQGINATQTRASLITNWIKVICPHLF